jgi:uncharacterized membrane protein YhiD involved in acid resistance
VNGLVDAFGPARVLDAAQILLALLTSFVLALVLATTYRRTYQGLSYSRSFVHSQVLGSVAVCIMIMAVGNNLARGLGILGALALVRFRTPIRDPRDIIFLFASLATGISCGAGVYMVAILGTICFSLMAVYLHWSPFASRRDYEGLVRFVLPPHAEAEAQIQGIFGRYCSSSVLVAMREAVQGDVIEYSYQVRLLDPSYQSDLLDALHKLPGIAEISMLMQRSTVEI